MSGAVVEFRRVSFAYPETDRDVLSDVNLGVPEGSFVLVAGQTGSGKSTLLRAINGLVPHFTGGRFSGRVLIAGRDTSDNPPRRLADVVAFVPQDAAASFVVDRVEDELAYALENLGVPPATMRRRVEETLDLLAIEELRDRSVRTLSGGERQRVAIAAALTPGAKVLVLDEPTSQLDPQGAEDVLAALQRLVHDLGVTVLVAEHRFERVAGFVDSAIGCFGGGEVRAGSPSDILQALGSGPPVARLGRLLGWSPIPLTVRDARRMVDVRPDDRNDSQTQQLERVFEAREIFAGYEGRDVLKGISLDLHRGEITALMGRNGAGKTTLLRSFAGLHELRDGTVRIAGRAPIPGRDVAYCPQTPEAVLFKDTVADEVRLTLDQTGAADDLDEVLAAAGILDLSAYHPRDLSSGQRLLVAVAAILATGAEVLLLDEPTRGLDHERKLQLRSLLQHHAALGRSVVVATHDVEFAAEIAQRVVMIAGGEVIADDEPSTAIGDSAVFAPQTARVFGPRWLTPESVAAALPA
ncbi:MAG: energy-coupling factor transport system ATP-binding protein [Actinomycetota bacterium]|jgi:energy-coupling factor transport system ATP-binding protein|nr:energy-coupling factor transport system ATP-binding protein [Actinomycetota bacterium]